jgi:hypothetical protein
MLERFIPRCDSDDSGGKSKSKMAVDEGEKALAGALLPLLLQSLLKRVGWGKSSNPIGRVNTATDGVHFVHPILQPVRLIRLFSLLQDLHHPNHPDKVLAADNHGSSNMVNQPGSGYTCLTGFQWT